MNDEEISQVKQGVVLLPMTAGEIVLAYNLPGVSELKLPRDVYSGIFVGDITNWSDPRIAAANEGVSLPDLPITVVVRSDGSGTTFVFTSHMATISDAFNEQTGAGKTVQWMNSDKLVKAPQNAGVTATILQTPGAIGYIEYGYAKQTGVPMASLENKAGNFITPGGDGGAEALASAKFDDNMRSFNTDPEGDGAYPISSFTWMLFYKDGQDPEKVAAIKQMIEYGLTDGQAMADQLGYIPMPAAVIDQVRAAEEKIGAGT